MKPHHYADEITAKWGHIDIRYEYSAMLHIAEGETEE
jgi:hypothetical protein